MAKNRKPKLVKDWWGVYNWGNLWHVYPHRRDALKFAKEETDYYQKDGKPQKWQSLWEIHKVSVQAVGKSGFESRRRKA